MSFDFCNTGYCVKDWLKKHKNTAYSPPDVEAYVKANAPLDACRDICNSNKHFTVTNYIPITSDVFASASGSMSAAVPASSSGLALEILPEPEFKVKVLLTNGTKYEVIEFAQKVVTDWDSFCRSHGIC